jgi:hypothetical protein
MNWRTPSLLGTLAASLLVMSCTSSAGGGGTGVSFSGGAVDGPCNPTYADEGCHYNVTAKGYERVNCVADTTVTIGGKWALKAACGASQLCKEIPQQGSNKKTSECYDAPVQSVPDTTSGGSDATTGGKDGTGSDVTVASSIACMKTQCSAEYNACKADSKCGPGLTCAEACKDDTCTKACTASLGSDAKFSAVAMCGLAKKCFGDISTGPECGNGQCESGESPSSCPADCKTTGNPVCGDGQCNGTETKATCPGDCGTTTSGKCGDLKCTSPENIETCPLDCDSTNAQTISCLQSMCGPQTSACVANADCVKFLGCAASCKGNSSCQSSCVQGVPSAAQGLVASLGSCAQTNKCLGSTTTGPVCGNGTCESGETTSSCPSDCKTTTSPKCGNGVCDAGEAGNCLVDCDSQFKASWACVVSKCKSQAAACSADTMCIGGYNCLAACKCNQSCYAECAGSLQSNSAAMALGECAQGSCPNPCPTTGPVCGNGTCESGESSSTCPSDCGAKPQCGNGKCETGETASSCPMDCGTAGQAGCAPGASGAKGCGGCACENCVCNTGTGSQAADDYCCTTAWDGTCANECSVCSPGYCSK